MSNMVYDLGLSVKAFNCVTRFGIETIDELEQRFDEFARHAPNLSKEVGIALDERRKAMSEKTITRPDNIITVDDSYEKAFSLNRKICFHAQSAQQNLFEVCKGLKEMRDGKLYKALGYANFEEYCEKEVGIGRKQAQKYLAVANMETGNSSSHFEQVGITKLALLAKLEEPQREEIQQTVNVGDVSVRELKEKISALTKQKDKLLERTQKAENQAERFNKQRMELCDKLDALKADLGQERDKSSELQEKNSKLDGELGEAWDTISELEAQIKELENRPRETFEDTTRIEELTKQLMLAEGKIARLEKDKEPARTAADTEAVFKAYMTAVLTSLNHVAKFLDKHRDDPAKEEFKRMLSETKNKIDGMIKC